MVHGILYILIMMINQQTTEGQEMTTQDEWATNWWTIVPANVSAPVAQILRDAGKDATADADLKWAIAQDRERRAARQAGYTPSVRGPGHERGHDTRRQDTLIREKKKVGVNERDLALNR